MHAAKLRQGGICSSEALCMHDAAITHWFQAVPVHTDASWLVLLNYGALARPETNAAAAASTGVQ
jgi:hypothetical protein